MTSAASRIGTVVLASAGLLGGEALYGQDVSPPPRPPEGSVIIHLPSADVPRAGTLSLLFTHRFSQPLAQSDFHSLYSFDSGADIGIGLSYTPWPALETGFYRSSNLDVYEVFAKYQFLRDGAFRLSTRAGGDFRTEKGLDLQPGYSRSGFFAQAILAFSVNSRVRITAVPTYVSQTSGQAFTDPRASYKNVFQVPAAVSIRVTRSVNIQAEVTPASGRADSAGVGWVAAIEKTVPGHRFAFTVGSVRSTTVDQYVRAVTPSGANPHDYYIGFNLVRQWKLK